MISSDLFSIRNKKEFEKNALEVFRFQAENNPVYKKYIQQLGIDTKRVKNILSVPFLPIGFFKTHEVVTNSQFTIHNSQLFLSSGTTGMERSKHFVSDISLYEKSFRKGFEIFYGDVKQYSILAFLPSYYENKNSSLLYMVNDLMKIASPKSPPSEGTLNQTKEALEKLLLKKKKVILFGVSFALMDFAEKFSLPNGEGRGGALIVIETGGMKGRREEITREELQETLCEKFGVKKFIPNME